MPSGSRLGPYEILSPLGAGGLNRLLVAVPAGQQKATPLTLVTNWASALKK